MRSTLLIVLAAAALSVALSFTPAAASSGSQITSLRHGIAWQRSATWRFQSLAGVPHAPTNYAERHTRSIAYLRWIEHRWNARRLHAKGVAARVNRGSVQGIICRVFGASQCGEALTIAERESGFETWAANGRCPACHLGIFQLGEGERATYATIGYSTVYEQVMAAHNLFKARGWEPWTCCEG